MYCLGNHCIPDVWLLGYESNYQAKMATTTGK